MPETRHPTFAKAAWGFLAYNALVILWGAYVRASGSGAGCGSHWPTCNGEFIPRPKTIATVIEFSHRLSSGLALVLSVVLAAWAFRIYPSGHRVRKASIVSLGFMMGEALIGAGLVLFQLVAHNQSAKRGLSMSLHLVNTFFLLASVVLMAYFASGGRALRIRQQGFVKWPIAVALLGVLVVGTSGGIAALGDTLFPVHSIGEGIAQDFSPSAHLFLRLRVLHPMFATACGVLVVGAGTVARSLRPNDRGVSICSRVLTGLFMVQLLVGLANVGLLAPVPLQLVHLFLADSVWIGLVLLAATTLAEDAHLVADPIALAEETAQPT